MSEPIVTKKCGHCKEIKEITKFHKNRAMEDGHHGICKKCRKSLVYPKSEETKRKQALRRKTTKGRQIEYESGKRYKANNKHKISSANAVAKAIMRGALRPAKKYTCWCGRAAQEYHHPSYDFSQRLNVIPLCRRCHIDVHLQLKSTG